MNRRECNLTRGRSCERPRPRRGRNEDTKAKGDLTCGMIAVPLMSPFLEHVVRYAEEHTDV